MPRNAAARSYSCLSQRTGCSALAVYSPDSLVRLSSMSYLAAFILFDMSYDIASVFQMADAYAT